MKALLTAPDSWLNGSPIRVWVIGAGGNGGEVADALAQFHTALLALGGAGLSVAIFDDAIVREVNIVRQRFWPSDVGCHKAITLANRYNCLLGTQWQGIPSRIEDALTRYKPKHAPDLIISAVDLPSVRRFIGNGFAPSEAEACSGELSRYQLINTLWLDLGNRARSGQAVIGKLLQDKQYPNVIGHYPELTDLEDDNSKSCSTAEAIATQDCLVNRMVATAGMSIVWELLRQGSTHKNGVVVDLASGMQMPIAFPEVEVESSSGANAA